MKAYALTVRVLIDPRVIGPDASTEWTTDASAYDYMSGLLTEQESGTVLDWGYIKHPERGFEAEVVDIDPNTYIEGDLFGIGEDGRS